MTVTGACLCGAVRYEIDEPFGRMTHCHCSMCRKHHGTAFATFAAAPLTGFRWVAGQNEIVLYASSSHDVRSFCRHCGSVTPTIMEAIGEVSVPAG
ncbi:MAG: GFA family protein, partial [Steroidobacteraceae bacterium]